MDQFAEPSSAKKSKNPGARPTARERGEGPGLLSRLPGMAYQRRNDPDWTMEFVSKGCHKLTGYKPSELIGDGGVVYGDLIHPEDRDAVWEEVQLAVTEDRPFELEYRITAANGSERWVWEQGHPVRDPNGELLGLEGFITDITERRKQRDSLAASRRTLCALTGQSLFGVYIIQDERFRYVNRAFADTFGYNVDEIVDNLRPSDLVAAEDREFVQEQIRRRIEGDVPALQYKFRGLTKDGAHIFVSAYGTYTEMSGRPAITGVLLDITKRRELEQSLRQADRIEAVGEVTGAVAHDFNNFLTGIIGHLGLALEDGQRDPEVRDHLQKAVDTAYRGAALTRKLLVFSKARMEFPQTVDLVAIVRDLVGFLDRMVGSPIDLKLEMPDAEIPVEVDPGTIEQLLMNLVLNARDAITNHGEIRVVVAREAAGTADERAVLRVSDTGVGMDQATLERIFNPFFTTKESGTGMGLSIVSRIVKELKGEVVFESTLGAGTTFEVLLPQAEGTTEVEPKREPKQQRKAGGTETVFVVDDDDSVRSVVVAALRRYGYEVWASRDPGEALQRLHVVDNSPDLLITDVMLPEMLGTELLEEFRAVDSAIKALLISGYAPRDLSKHRDEMERETFLEKPFSVEGLLDAVRQALDGESGGTRIA